MISYASFGRLRLSQFRPDTVIAELDNYEFMDHKWVGEAIGFSEWLRPENKPDTLQSLAIDFAEFPRLAAKDVLEAIDLNVAAGMGFQEVKKLLGVPIKEYRFANDRISYDFRVAGPPAYDVSFTFLTIGGLTYLVVMVPLPSALG